MRIFIGGLMILTALLRICCNTHPTMDDSGVIAIVGIALILWAYTQKK